MILEVLLALPIGDKYFYYKSTSLKENNLKIGQLININFRGKKQVGLIVGKPKRVNFNKPISEIEFVYNDLSFNEEILKSINFLSRYSCNSLSNIFKNFISGFNEKEDETSLPLNEFKTPELSNEQKRVLTKINKVGLSKFKAFTLSGITGSGKTRIYMYLVKEKLMKKFQCLIMVPEIILTKEWVKEISEDFGINTMVYHSSIKISEKHKIWGQVIKGKPILVIGTRSALFLPFKNLGIIIVDEEHDQSYKQEEKLIMNARDFAIVRAKNSGCPIILSSATPSIETMQNCVKGKFLIVEINKRINNTPLPSIKIVNMRKEKKLISDSLINQIKINIKNNHQSMIFINKRGYTSFVICKKCGFIKSCPNCDISLVLHNFGKRDSTLLCHHCSYNEFFKNYCSNCKSNNSLDFPGEGIEKIYQEVISTFPNSKNIFISSDSIKKSKNLNKILTDIKSNKVDIIVGTQILSKGHNFPFLKTVGIINIDNLLNDFDFRSSEKCFQQIIQVSGRAGRKNLAGNVIIQTLEPAHSVLQNCMSYSFKKFYNEELLKRKKNNHPPYSNFISLIIKSTNNNLAKKFSFLIVKNLSFIFKSISIYGPASAVISMKNKNYRHRILLKIKKDQSLQENVKNFLKNIKPPPLVKFYIDVDPVNFL